MPSINVLSKNKKNIIIFHLKINIFTAVKYCCILHGHVCIMASCCDACLASTVNQLILFMSFFRFCLLGYFYTIYFRELHNLTMQEQQYALLLSPQIPGRHFS